MGMVRHPAAGGAVLRALIRLTLPLFLVPALLAASPAPGAGKSPYPALVRIVNTSQRASWYSPWETPAARRNTGSGFVVAGGRVLTNAHVVSDSRMLVIFRDGDSVPHEARVVAVGHDCDLALLEPVDAGLLSQVRPLEFGDLPDLGASVETLGYPVGGERISLTRGVVSRIEVQLYLHSGFRRHLAIQTDSAINPGNSGGPVLRDGKVVGVAFQVASGLQSVGYVIPVPVIRHFLEDVADGHYDGFPLLGIRIAGLENPAARREAGLPAGQTGARVDAVWPDSSAAGRFRVGDVLLRIDGETVDNSGQIVVKGQQLDVTAIVDRHQVGKALGVVLFRDGARVELSVPLRGLLAEPRFSHQYDRLPRYYVHGGLVFVELDVEMLKTFGQEWYEEAERPLLYEGLVRPFAEPERQKTGRVVLLRRLDHPVNMHIAWWRNEIVDRVNGREVVRLEDLIDAVESNEGRFEVFEFARLGRFVVLDRGGAATAQPTILKRYGLPSDRRL